MNEARVKALAATVLALMLLIPPWNYTTGRSGAKIVKPAGYYLVFEGASPEPGNYTNGIEINLPRLLVQCASVAAIAAGMVFWRQRKDKDRK